LKKIGFTAKENKKLTPKEVKDPRNQGARIQGFK
jgi:hypothetical protein